MANTVSTFAVPCWIYILQDGANAEYQVGYTTNMSERMRQTDGDGTKLVYLRMFDDFSAAIGYKLFLEQISIQSLRRIVRIYNPGMKDLRDELQITNYKL